MVKSGVEKSILKFLQAQNYFFPSISYYFQIPIIFDFFDFHCPNLEKIGTDEKVICYHNISNLLWKKDVLCVWKKMNLKNITNSRPFGLEFANFFLDSLFFPHTRTIFSHSMLEQLW